MVQSFLTIINQNKYPCKFNAFEIDKKKFKISLLTHHLFWCGKSQEAKNSCPTERKIKKKHVGKGSTRDTS